MSYIKKAKDEVRNELLSLPKYPYTPKHKLLNTIILLLDFYEDYEEEYAFK